MRDALLLTHAGEWVAIADGRVIAHGSDLIAVTDEAAKQGGHPYVAKVGEEDRVVFKVRETMTRSSP